MREHPRIQCTVPKLENLPCRGGKTDVQARENSSGYGVQRAKKQAERQYLSQSRDAPLQQRVCAARLSKPLVSPESALAQDYQAGVQTWLTRPQKLQQAFSSHPKAPRASCGSSCWQTLCKDVAQNRVCPRTAQRCRGRFQARGRSKLGGTSHSRPSPIDFASLGRFCASQTAQA